MIGVDFSSVNTMLVVIKIIRDAIIHHWQFGEASGMFESRKMHDICMREVETKFQLSHIDDVGEGGERGRTCVFTQRIAPTCALYTALR